MLVAISYDISDNRIRANVSRILMSYGERVQKSVFECHISSSQLSMLMSQVEEVIQSEKDSVIYYIICKNCKNLRSTSGKSSVTEEIMEIIV